MKEQAFQEEWLEEHQTHTVDEDRLLDWMEEVVNPENGPATTGRSILRLEVQLNPRFHY